MRFHSIRIFFIAIGLTATWLAGSAQRQNIQVDVSDSADKKALSKATAIIVGKKDSVLLDFGITDSIGSYLFRNVNLEKAGSMVFSVKGYRDKTILLPVPANTEKSRLPNRKIAVYLTREFVLLEDVLVKANASVVRMNRDTLEFNADFFKSQPNAVLEDLLRKLPGVEIRNRSEVYVNGQRVNKILVDGKEFFSEDPIVILKNLPAEIIAKIQVADEKNTVAKETRQKKDIPKTINLTLKKEFKKGAFGKFFAGQGTKGRHETGGLLNMFRDTLQVSIIGSSNNQGRSSISWQDLNDLGGFSRSEGLGGQTAGNLADDFRRGIETKNLAGVNVNYNTGKSLQLNGQYFYNQTKRRSDDQSFSRQFLGDSILLSNSSIQGGYREDVHKASAGMKWKQDSTGYLTAQMNGSFSNSLQRNAIDSKTFSPAVPLLSGTQSSKDYRNNQVDLSVNADYSKTFVPAHLDWSLNGSYSNTGSDVLSAANSRYRRIVNNFLPDSVRQQLDNSMPAGEVNLANNISKNWKNKHSLSWKAAYANRRETIGGNAYRFSETTGKDDLVPGLSVKLILEKQRLNNQLLYRYSYKGFTVQPGLSVHTLVMRNRYNYDTIPVLRRTFHLVTPALTVNYKGFGLWFDRSFQEPYSYSLRPVTDSSNPLYVTTGNPDLKPAVRSVAGLEYYVFFDRLKINIYLSSNAEKITEAVGESRQIYSDGKIVQQYVNLKVVNNYTISLFVSKSYNKNNWNYNASLNGSFVILKSPLILNQKIIRNVTTFLYPRMELVIGYKSKYKWQVGYRLKRNWSRSDDASLQTADVSQHMVYNTFHVQVLPKISWDASLNYNLNPGISTGYRKQWYFCDMAVTLSMLRNDRVQVKLSGYDIFNSNQDIFRYANQNYVTEFTSLVQKQYFMLTVFYSLKKY